MKFWLQYHNYDKLGYLPGAYTTDLADLSKLDTSAFEPSVITTSKPSIKNAIGDVVFFIVGYGKDKQYILWSWCVVEDVYLDDDERFEGTGSGAVLNPPPVLSGPEFDEFKRSNANFSLGFRNISNLPFVATLAELAQKYGTAEWEELSNGAAEPIPQELPPDQKLYEGAKCKIVVNAYERNAKARRDCLAVHKPVCCICGFDFGAAYGPEFNGLIHVHHLCPLSEIGEEYVINGAEDLRPVCPNCHAVIHYQGQVRGMDDVRTLLARQRLGSTTT